jgi:hypothetical protein
MWYMPMHLAARELGGSLYRFSIFESICLFDKKACLLALISKFGEGGDNKNSMVELRSTKTCAKK